MKRVRKFVDNLFSDSNRVSSKRFVGLLCLIMFMGYGIKGMFMPFNLEFSIFYVSLCSVTMWIAFRFMSSEKALKYNVLGQLTKFNMKEAVQQVMGSETELDDAVQPPGQEVVAQPKAKTQIVPEVIPEVVQGDTQINS